jgi:hypothetical protein
MSSNIDKSLRYVDTVLTDTVRSNVNISDTNRKSVDTVLTDTARSNVNISDTNRKSVDMVLTDTARSNVNLSDTNNTVLTDVDKVLFIGDVHIKFTNLKDLETLEDKMLLQIKDRPSFIVVAGDILDTHEKINSQLMNRAYGLINKLKTLAPVYVLVGNHDYINNKQFLTTNHWMNGMKDWYNVYVIDYPQRIEGVSGHTYVLIPYVPPGRFVEALDKLEGWQTATCIFAHQEIKNCKMGCITSIEGDEWREEWPMLVSGHIHERQYVGSNVLYPGSVLNHAFGSDNQGISKFLFKAGVMNEERVNIGLVKKSIVYKDVNKINEINIEKLMPHNKLCLSGDPKDIKTFKNTNEYRILKKNGIKVAFKVNKLNPTEKHRKVAGIPFMTILQELVYKEQNHDLEKDFTLIKV